MINQNNIKYLWMVVLLVCIFADSGFSQPAITGIGNYDFPASGGLSGITWISGNQYYLINDSGQTMHVATININSATGAITSASVDTDVILSSGSDLEGIAYDPDGNEGAGSVYISDEVGPAVREYSLDGTIITTLPVPGIYATGRTNKLFESLTISADSEVIWTANEEALTNDGPISNFTVGTIVRLQRFVRGPNGYIANGQWAYQTEKIAHDSPWVDNEQNGLCDLCVLPNGQLLALERQVTGNGTGLNFPEFRNKIYLIDLTGAMDVSDISALDGATYTMVGKTYLWSASFPLGSFSNYEGLGLGMQLDDGSYSLLMISDGDDGEVSIDEDLYALKISGLTYIQVTITSPNGCESLLVGANHTITWQSQGELEFVILEYSINNGASWIPIDTVPNTGSYEWLVPDMISQQCLIRISDVGYTVTDRSDEPFTIDTCSLRSDLTGDCCVDIEDLAVFINSWLDCNDPGNPECSNTMD